VAGRLRIDLEALCANYRVFRDAAAGAAVAAVVKADAYGLGVEAVAPALWHEGCRNFFVADCGEGTTLRNVLRDARIFVFEGVLDDTIEPLLNAGLTPVLNHEDQLRLWRERGCGAQAAVHVDTGMHRLGFPVEVDPAVFDGLSVSLLMTHLACADESVHPLTGLQLERFSRIGRRFRARFPDLLVSVGNSAGILGGAEPAGGLGRPGIGLYGGNPLLGSASPVRPVVTLEGRILQVRRVLPGESVGYGATFRAAGPLDVAIAGLGYADGLPRLLSNRGEAYVQGRRCPIVGRVSMDLTTVDVTGLAVAAGDWIEFMGSNVSVDEIAAWAETIPYEILTGLGCRLERRYLNPSPAA
jgi:alanine racemase